MTSRPSSTRPPSAATVPIARPQAEIHPTAVISDKAQLVGSHAITIGADAVLHPYAKVRAEGSRVTIGKGVIISETALVGLSVDDHEPAFDELVIEDGVNIEGGAEVLAKSIGEYTVVEVKAKIGKGAVIGKFCKITPLCEIEAGEEVPDYTVVFGDKSRRTSTTMASNASIRDVKLKGHMMEVELLKKLIPNAADKWR